MKYGIMANRQPNNLKTIKCIKYSNGDDDELGQCLLSNGFIVYFQWKFKCECVDKREQQPW